MNNIKVSIIMPSLNVAEYIHQSIESAVNQTLKEIEIISVDAGSTDGTLDSIESFMVKDTRVRLIRSPVKSYGYQVNLGISVARGKYIGIIETDDFVKPEMYEELYKIAEEHQVDFVKTDFYRFYSEVGDLELKYRKLLPDRYYGRIINPTEDLNVFSCFTPPWNGIYKRSVLEANRIRFNETEGAAYQDNGFGFQVFCCAKRAFFVNKPYYMLRRNNPNSSVRSSNWFPRMITEYDYIYNWLIERNIFETFKGHFALKKFTNLVVSIDRATSDKKLEYSRILAKEMAKHINSGEYDKSCFSAKWWEWLQTLIDNPIDFCIKRVCYVSDNQINTIKTLESDIRDKNRELKVIGDQLKATKSKLSSSLARENALKHSISFRIGRAITWFPRKVRGGVRCFNQHGTLYTAKRLCWHIINLK